MTIELPEGSMILDRIQAYARVRDIPSQAKKADCAVVRGLCCVALLGFLGTPTR